MRLLHAGLNINLFFLSKVCVQHSNTHKDDAFLLQNIIKYCSFRHTKLKFPCLSMLHMKTVYQLLQEEREVTPWLARSAACSFSTPSSLQACPVTAHSTTHSPLWNKESHVPTSTRATGLLTQSHSWSYSQNPGLTGVNGKRAIDPHEAKFHPLPRL